MFPMIATRAIEPLRSVTTATEVFQIRVGGPSPGAFGAGLSRSRERHRSARSELEAEGAELGFEGVELAAHALGSGAAGHGARRDGAGRIERLQ